MSKAPEYSPAPVLTGSEPACKTADPTIFYPEPGESFEPALAVCRGCDLVVACLRYSLENEEVHGVWGGMTVKQRARLLRTQAVA